MGPRAGLDGRKISSRRDSIRDRPARSQSLYRLSYPAHCLNTLTELNYVADPMEQSPCVETTISAASTRDSRILLNPKVHFPVHTSPPPGPVVSQINPVHVPPPPSPTQSNFFYKIHFTTVHPFMPRYSKWSVYPRFPHQNSVCTSSLPHACHTPHPIHS